MAISVRRSLAFNKREAPIDNTEAIIAVNKEAIGLLRLCLKHWPYDSDQGSIYQEVIRFLNGYNGKELK